VVVDNGSTDGSRAMLRDEFPEVRVVANETPRGYGASHNQGFGASRGRYFLVLNNDMTVCDGALDAMIERMGRGDGIGLLGCRLRNPDGSVQVSCGRESSVLRMVADDLIPAAVPVEWLGLREWMREWGHDVEREVAVVQGSCMMLPRDVFESAGGFDEGFEFFREEYDLCRRVRMLGRRVLFFPDAEIVHFGGQTMKTIPLPAFQKFVESRYKYFAKYWGRGAARAVTCSAFVGAAIRWATWEAVGVLHLRSARLTSEKRALYRTIVPWFFNGVRPWFSGESGQTPEN
jgi:hypothetical protein